MTCDVSDMVLVAATLVAALFGAICGFSGSLAFLFATLAASGTSVLVWPYLPQFCTQPWTQLLAVLVIALLVFGVVRVLVRRVVKGLLAQPADAIFGFLTGGVTGFLFCGVCIWFLSARGFLPAESSKILQTLLQFTRYL